MRILLRMLPRILLISLLMLASIQVSAAGVPYSVHVQNPEQDIAYFVGDVIRRTVELDVMAPYELAPGSVPVKGMMRKGIELRDIQLSQRKSHDATHYRLELAYQVFTRADYAKKVELPREVLQLKAGGARVTLAIPAWQFQVSPISAHGETYLEQDMSHYRGPLLVDFGYPKLWMGVFLGMVLAAFGGLVYINGDANWFPGMGGPFAASYRKVASLPDDPASALDAATAIHKAFNQTFGENVFHHNLEQFLHNNSGFQAIRAEISAFFELSNHLLYGVSVNSQQSSDISSLISLLREFCRRCRDCERGIA